MGDFLCKEVDPYIYVTKGILDIYYYLHKIKYKINQGGRLIQKTTNNISQREVVETSIILYLKQYGGSYKKDIELLLNQI